MTNSQADLYKVSIFTVWDALPEQFRTDWTWAHLLEVREAPVDGSQTEKLVYYIPSTKQAIWVCGPLFFMDTRFTSWEDEATLKLNRPEGIWLGDGPPEYPEQVAMKKVLSFIRQA